MKNSNITRLDCRFRIGCPLEDVIDFFFLLRKMLLISFFFYGRHERVVVALLENEIYVVPLTVFTFPFVQFETTFHYLAFSSTIIPSNDLG